ncbi:rod shape-determining protein RodA [Ascidiimonas sp. W6]|uniref:rod shape-determining protein RodA n=1 Tax=Ascidiimonas meishanensis TaxID=3128903 RepID=UPI0030EB5D14
MNNKLLQKTDWFTILIYAILVFIGWLNIYSATLTEVDHSLLDLTQSYGKQLLFIGVSLVTIMLIMAVDAKFYERFSSIIYLISLVSLVALFLFGKNINGATSWYSFGSITLQPSEFAKAATALALAKHLSDIQTNIHVLKDQMQSFLIIALPALLIIPQPDPGSAMVYAAFFFVLYREGLSPVYLLIGLGAAALFVATLVFGPAWVAVIVFFAVIIFFAIQKRKKKRTSILPFLVTLTSCIIFSFSVRFIYDNVFEQRHRDRFSLWLRLEKDPVKLEKIKKTIGYNTNQSEEAIGSGGFFGKGFLEGTRTKGDFVPEQHTDYIFSTVGEEWGFLGSAAVVILFTILLLRLLFLAERQKSQFSRIYGYSVASILFFHFAINIGMVIGLLPTIGIPLPFFSYGGSGLLGFTILLFIFLKLDANRINEWL